jgi:hypothetical protein
MPTSPGLTPTNGMSFYYSKFSYKQETLVSSKYKCKKTKNCKKNNKVALKAQRNCNITDEKRFETKLKEVLN